MDNEQAWILLAKKLAGEATPEDIAALHDLLKSNPNAQYLLEIFSPSWKDSEALNANDDTEILFARHIKRLALSGYDMTLMAGEKSKAPSEIYPWDLIHKKHTARKILLPFLFLLIAGGIFFYFIASHQNKNIAAKKIASTLNEVSTKYGSKSQVVLPDGTHVWLNAGSKLSYENDFADKPAREVTLSGEAFFDVTHRGGQPFIIHTTKLDIKVLGTAFNVRSYPGDETMEATLLRGSIEVSFHENPSRKIILKPNEKITVYNNRYDLSKIDAQKNTQKEEAPDAGDVFTVSHIHRFTPDSIIAETSWINNKLSFQHETFDDLSRQMERWYNVSFHFSTGKLMEYQFTGSFTTETIDQALRALQLTSPSSPFRYRIEKQDVYIYTK